MEMLTNIFVRIMLQYLCISNNDVAHLQLVFVVRNISIWWEIDWSSNSISHKTELWNKN